MVETYLPLLNKNLPETAKVLAGVGEKLIGVFTKPENVEIVDRLFGSNNKIIDDLGTAISNLASTFLILLDAARPLAEELSEWVKNLTDGWKESIEADSKSGQLSKTLEYAWKVAKDLKDIFADLIGTIKNIGVAAAGPGSGGEMLLGWIKDAVARWKEFTGSEEGQSRLEKFFQNVAPVAREVFRILGSLGKAIFETTEAGVDPGKGAPLLSFFQSITSAVDKFTALGPQLNNVLPIVGDAIDSAAGAIANLTSSGAIESFFGILKEFADFAQNLTSNPIFQQIFGIVAPIFAVSRGLSLILTFSRFLFMGAIVGGVMQFVDAFKSFKGFFAAGGALSKLPLIGPGLSGALAPILGATGPLLAVIGIIAGLVLIFVALWNESEVFRKAIKDLIDGVLAKAQEVFQKLKDKVEQALKPLGGTAGLVDKLKTAFKFLGDILGKYVIPFFEAGLKNALDIIGAVLGTVIDFVGNLIAAFDKIITGIKTGDIGMVFEGIADAIMAPFKAILTNLTDLFKSIFDNVVTAVKKVLGIASPSSVFEDIGQAILDGVINIITFLPEKMLELFLAAWKKVSEWFTNTAGPAILTWKDKITEWIKGVWDAFYNFLKEQWDKIVLVYGPSGIIATFLKGLPAKFLDWLSGVWDSLYDFLAGPDGIWSKVTSFFGIDGTIHRAIKTLVRNFTNWLSDLWSPLLDGLKGAWDLVKTWWNQNVALTWTIDVPDWVPGPDEVSVTIPKLASGGTVFPRMGGTLATIAEAGRPERIEPLDPDGLSKRDKAMISYLTGGAGGATINVYPSEGMNERELAQMVSKELAYMMRKGGI